MIDVDYVVTGLDLVEFPERKRQFPSARLVGAEIVVVETVKYLMVGEETCLGGMVHKSLMDCVFHGCELYLVAAVLEDGAETVGLVDGVGEDKDAVPFGEESGEAFGYEAEVLVV